MTLALGHLDVPLVQFDLFSVDVETKREIARQEEE